ncbi:hypothetical protein [Prevotella sp. S7-1-8]|uniref:hypothetical protein n=1 Tax=Prevotella sp. S7-1-8 TaxID=1284775 RepID=UPI001E608D48|nr:hypothetical protein [Prevotella sp. S7-1-8]
MIQISDETDNNRPLFFCVLRSFHPKPTEIVTGNKHEKSAISLILVTLQVKQTIKLMLITNLISRYMKLLKAAFSVGDGSKLNKSIHTNAMETLFLLMGMPRRRYFARMVSAPTTRAELLTCSRGNPSAPLNKECANGMFRLAAYAA